MFRKTFFETFPKLQGFSTDKQTANFESIHQNQSQIIEISYSFLKIAKNNIPGFCSRD